MREIKFRVWLKRQNKYLKKDEQYILPIINQGKLLVGIDDNNEMFMGDVLEQYTGLKDKNGVEIYEGDIVVFDDEEWDKIVVKYGVQNVDAFEGIGFNLWSMYGKYIDIGKAKRLQSEIKVIGNIHEELK